MLQFISENASLIIIAAIVLSVMAFVIAGIKYKKDHPDGVDAEIEKMLIDPESVTTTVRATVIDMACSADMVGTKMPKAVRNFVVIFQAENGEILKINVPEEMYDGFDKGQTGILTLADGDLYSFEIE
ncbi:MAG: hypothetical protein J6Q94_02450 [Clostridia bacterium]|nr:hypothetical protein [Clostridia bacterium]